MTADLGELERLARAALQLVECEWFTVEHLGPENFEPQDAAFIAAANPATILALISRLRAAEGALRPFAEAADNMDGDEPDTMGLWESPEAMLLTFGNLRAARAAARPVLPIVGGSGSLQAQAPSVPGGDASATAADPMEGS